MKHTEVNWNYRSLNKCKDRFDIFDGLNNVEIAIVYNSNEANAKLIAAAPELLEALKLVSDDLKYALGEERSELRSSLIKSFLAINKATE